MRLLNKPADACSDSKSHSASPPPGDFPFDAKLRLFSDHGDDEGAAAGADVAFEVEDLLPGA